MAEQASQRSPAGATSVRGLGLTIHMDRLPQVRARLQSEGVSNWARRHGFKPKTVFGVLSGSRACTWGKSHDIAVALGLKDRVG
ncbi:MAG: hypothetical protein JO290_11875 [Sphingomonadaceae bacterium]|nr:hypothetical protein [Sphingomonadaceae bacterium]